MVTNLIGNYKNKKTFGYFKIISFFKIEKSNKQK